MKFSIKDFFSKCDKIRGNLRVWLHLMKKSLMENFIFLSIAFSETIDAYQDVLATIFVCNPLSVFICSNKRSWEPDMNYEMKNSSF